LAPIGFETTEYLKKANPPTETIDSATGETVQRMLAEIKREGREAVERYARDLDGYSGKIVLDESDFAAAAAAVPAGVRDDIAFAHQREGVAVMRDLMRGEHLVAGRRLPAELAPELLTLVADAAREAGLNF
jgi:histidinol dehydrogenase